MYSNLCSRKCCISNHSRIMSFEGKLLSSSSFMRYILEYSKGRNLAGSRSLGFGSLPCRSHLIMTNLKVLAMTLCLENEKEVPYVHVCHGFKWYRFTSFLESFV